MIKEIRKRTLQKVLQTMPLNQRPAIEPRRSSFDYSDLKTRFWFRDNSILSGFFASMSAVFPPGEREFVRSVFHYRDQIKSPELLQKVREFASQEGEHARQHKMANEVLDSMGYNASKLSAHLQKHIDKFVETMDAEDLLAATAAMEHITAILADHMLRNPEVLRDMPESTRELLKWHAVEEIEHKAVAFDVYDEVVSDRERLRKVYRFVTTEFILRLAVYTVATLYWQRHIPRPREWAGAYRFFFGKDGFITDVRDNYRDFNREDFHPWQLDNRHLVDAWKAEHQNADLAAE